ncbi:MAG: F0F1 ATP synthase subunit B [Acidimicrobiales bacterium]
MLAFLAAEEGNGFWLPHDINEVIWGTIAFVLVFGVIIWKAGPAIKAMAAARPERIKAELDTAASARAAAESKVADVKAALADSDKEAARILDEARETAAKLTTDLAARAQADADAVREQGLAEIAAARRQAQADLSAEVSRLALGAAERVVQSNLDDSTQQSLIESYISQVGASN